MKKGKRPRRSVRLKSMIGRMTVKAPQPTPYVPPIDAESPDFYRGYATTTYHIPTEKLREVLGLSKEWTLIDGAAYDAKGGSRRDLFDERVEAVRGVECIFRVAVPGPLRAMEILAGTGPKNV